MKTARLIRTISQGNDHFQQHYTTSDIGEILVSQIWGPYGCETYIFECDGVGDITDYIELPGSRKGVIPPRDLLVELGYEVKHDLTR